MEKYREFALKCNIKEQLITELNYEIATARVDNIELLRMTLVDRSEGDSFSKLKNNVKNYLKKIKQEGRIQFFATEEAIMSQTTEVDFLRNKYPDVDLIAAEEGSGEYYIYVKI